MSVEEPNATVALLVAAIVREVIEEVFKVSLLGSEISERISVEESESVEFSRISEITI